MHHDMLVVALYPARMMRMIASTKAKGMPAVNQRAEIIIISHQL